VTRHLSLEYRSYTPDYEQELRRIKSHGVTGSSTSNNSVVDSRSRGPSFDQSAAISTMMMGQVLKRVASWNSLTGRPSGPPCDVSHIGATITTTTATTSSTVNVPSDCGGVTKPRSLSHNGVEGRCEDSSIANGNKKFDMIPKGSPRYNNNSFLSFVSCPNG